MRALVTTADFWRKVGEDFLLRRVRLKLDRHHVKTQLGGPDGRTIEQIETGTPGHVAKLDELARAYGVELTDVFAAVLPSIGEPVTPEARRILRKLQTTTVEGRSALLALVAALPDAPGRETPGGSEGSPTVPAVNTAGNDR